MGETTETKEDNLLDWTYEDTKVEELPKNVKGFIYLLTLSTGQFYVGRKDRYSNITKPAKKDGSMRDGHIRFKGRNVLIDPETGHIARSREDKKKLRAKGIKATRETYEELRVESKWQSYLGSSEHVDTELVIKKEILEYAPTLKSISFLEEKYLFKLDTMEDNNYINKNIRGVYFKGDLL